MGRKHGDPKSNNKWKVEIIYPFTIVILLREILLKPRKRKRWDYCVSPKKGQEMLPRAAIPVFRNLPFARKSIELTSALVKSQDDLNIERIDTRSLAERIR